MKVDRGLLMNVKKRLSWKNGILTCFAAVALLSVSAQTGRAQAPNVAKTAEVDPQQRERQIAADKARLLKLAAELKDEVDKSGADTLSLSVIHKADDIEKLARSIKQQMNRR